jgi:hypothetical protein
MNDEKTLDEALDECDAWGNQVADTIARLSPEEVVAYFAQAMSRLEQTTGKPLNLPVRTAPSQQPIEQRPFSQL